MADKDETSLIKIPRWVWGTIGILATLVAGLLISFFSWLGITTTKQGKTLETNRVQIEHIDRTVSKIESKIETLPPKEFITLPIEVNALKADAENRERQLDALERRVDKLERRHIDDP